jgi:hypothetical protein
MRNSQNLCKTAIVILIWNGFSALATVYDSDGSSINVQSIHDILAQNGDTITLPVGAFTWTTGVTVTKAITLQGAGFGNTIVRDNVQNAKIITWTLVAGNASRLTGIEFQDGGGTHSAAPTGAFHVDGSNTEGSTFRMDHCYWNNINGSPVFDTVIGVLDHNTFYVLRGGWIMVYIYGTRWNGQNYGDGSWAAATNFGSSQFLFMEDNTFTFNVGGLGTITDAYDGARFVVRYNTIHDGVLNNHGTESSGRGRGGRAYEAYNNIYAGSGWNKYLAGSRSGVMLFHDNTISGYWGRSATCGLGNYRTHYPSLPWSGADGANVWDFNETGKFFTGTAAVNNSGTTVTVNGANWTTNQWRGYSVRRLSNVCNSNSLTFALIVSNTSNSITYTDNGGYATPSLSFCSGDSLEFRKIFHVLDGIGRAGGSLISGTNPTPPANWNDQATEACYSWNNVITDAGGAHANFGDVDASIRINEHYFNDAPMPGYTPYVYPHPLVSDPPLPSPTPSATVTPSPTPTPTPTPSPTPPPSPTPSPPPSPTPTSTPAATPTSTPTATATATSTATPQPSSTPTATPTATARPTATATPRHSPKPHPTHGAVKG